MAIRLTVLLFIPRRKSRLSPWYSVRLAKLRSAITGPLCIFACDVTINKYLLTDFAIKSAIFHAFLRELGPASSAVLGRDGGKMAELLMKSANYGTDSILSCCRQA